MKGKKSGTFKKFATISFCNDFSFTRWKLIIISQMIYFNKNAALLKRKKKLKGYIFGRGCGEQWFSSRLSFLLGDESGMMAVMFPLLSVASRWMSSSRSPDEGAFSNPQCLQLILWEKLYYFLVWPTHPLPYFLSPSTHLQSIRLAKVAPQSMRSISLSDF